MNGLPEARRRARRRIMCALLQAAERHDQGVMVTLAPLEERYFALCGHADADPGEFDRLAAAAANLTPPSPPL